VQPTPEEAPEEKPSFNDFVTTLLTIHFHGFEYDEDEEQTAEVMTQDILAPHIEAAGLDVTRRHIGRRAGLHHESRVPYIVIMMVKACTGTIALFLPRAMMNGGFFLVACSFICITFIEFIGISLLVESAERVMEMSGGEDVPSYGKVASVAMGPMGGRLANLSFFTTNIGFCAAYVIFIINNSQELLRTVSYCFLDPDALVLAAVATVVLAPLCWVRKMKHYGLLFGLGNVCVFIGLVVVLSMLTYKLVIHGPPAEPPVWVKTDTYALALGTCICAFEGAIGATMSMYESAAPQLRPRYLTIFGRTVTAVVLSLTAFGVVCYLALTNKTESIVLLNLPVWPTPGSSITAGVQTVQVVAILCTYPIVMFPVVKYMEARLLPQSGRHNTLQKWTKNVFRSVVVILISVLGVVCKDSLDNYIALVGGLCSAPVCLVYPGIMHLKIVGTNKFVSCSVVVLGIAISVFCTYQAVASWNFGGGAPDPCGALPHQFAEFR
jgi:proton-coupled amino acid transporter